MGIRMSEIAIKVDDVSKMYKMYDKPMDRLKESLGLTRRKCYKEHYALNHISFQVYKGETVGIIGTNGAGKSTILKIITGVLGSTAGQVQVNGRISALLELGAGFNSEYTGIENVYLNGTMIGFSKEEIDAKLSDILDFADIGDFVYQPVKTYSSGMFVRLAFAVAINIEPEILIVDEALSVGDVFFQAKCYRKFEEFKQMGKTILFVSHDLNAISKYCDRVILLNKGKRESEGDPKEMVDLYKQLIVNQTATTDGSRAKRTGREEIPDHWYGIFDMNPNVQEYGDKKAVMTAFQILDEKGLHTNTIEKGKEFTLQVRVRYLEDVDDPIYAFSLKNLRGTEISGTNTMYEKIAIQPRKKGQVDIVSYRQKMDMQGGEYLISFGCTGYEVGEFVVHHRLYDVGSIVVVSSKNTTGFYDMNSEITIEEERA